MELQWLTKGHAPPCAYMHAKAQTQGVKTFTKAIALSVTLLMIVLACLSPVSRNLIAEIEMLSPYNLSAYCLNTASMKQNLTYVCTVYFSQSKQNNNAIVLVKMQHVKSHINVIVSRAPSCYLVMQCLGFKL